MPEGSPQEGEVWSDIQHQMHHVLDVSGQWVAAMPSGALDYSVFPLDIFLRDFRYIGTPAQPYQPDIVLNSFWYLREHAQNIGGQGEIFTVYGYQDGVVRFVDNDDYDRVRRDLPEAVFRRLFHVGVPLSDESVMGADFDMGAPGGPYRDDDDEEHFEAVDEPDMEVLRVILANIPPGMALERVTRALASEYREAVEDMREDGTLIQFSGNGTLLVDWNQNKPPEEPAEAPSLWDRLEEDDAPK